MIHRSLASLTLILGALTLSNCTSNTPQSRISKNPDIYHSLKSEDQRLVQQGQIKQGMNKKAVYLAWGNPSRSSTGINNGAAFEKWYYYQYSPSYSGSFYGGYGRRGYYGTSLSRTNDYSSELEAQVEFREGHVFNWENAK